MTDTLYAGRGSNLSTSNLYTVDTASPGPSVTSIGAIGDAVTGFAIDPTSNILYGVTTGSTSGHVRSLITIDTTTGAGTLVGSLGGKAIPDIAFDNTGQMYGWDNTNHQLARIDKATGAVTDIGSSGISSPYSGNGLAITSTNTAYLFPKGSFGAFYSMNLSTGAGTSAGTLDGSGLTTSGDISAASCKADDTVWLVVSLFLLATCDVGTGVLTQVGGSGGIGGLSSWDALTWTAGTPAPPPPPPSPPPPAEGICIAFDDGPLVAAPSWTRIDQ